MSAAERASLERERAELRRELLEWLRIATGISSEWREAETRGWQLSAETAEARFRVAAEAAERIAGLIRSLPDEELPAGFAGLVGG